MKPNKRFGRRGAALLVLGALSFVYGLAVFNAQPPPEPGSDAVVSQTIVLYSIMPWVWWAWCWVATGVLAIFQALLRRADRWAFTFLSFMWIIWTAALATGHIVEPGTRTYVAPLIYGVVVLLIYIVGGWPEPPDEVINIDLSDLDDDAEV